MKIIRKMFSKKEDRNKNLALGAASCAACKHNKKEKGK